jgi:putative ATP-dependent endonuclease of OLD family
MRIESITLSGFRSFGPAPHRVALAGDLTAIVGPNASGKTALLQALVKLFGVTRIQRTVLRSDFHLPIGMPPDDRTTKNMFIDVEVAVPELADGSATAHTVAPAFKHMLIGEPKATPVCRLRLEAQWQDDGTAEGEVTQNLYWVEKLDANAGDDDKHQVSATDRGLIQVYYTPASRDAAAQIRATTGALASRLLRAIAWSKETRATIDAATKSLSDAFTGEAAITAITDALSDRWSELDGLESDADPNLTLISQRFDEVVAKIHVLFDHGTPSIQRELDALSDGQQSLFYFALAAAVCDLERKVVEGSVAGFNGDELRVPALTVFAIEEPENHLSPYYLSRIVGQVRSLTEENAAQAVLTSHSPAVLSRVEPAEVRYCRCDQTSRISTVRQIELPPNADDAAKFVRGALLAFPELYFARFVILVEGDSERVVLPRLAVAERLMLDPSFVAVVPLGGRHVQHFWRLLRILGVPYATLLDLDLGRSGGAYGRIKTVIGELIQSGVARADLLTLKDGQVMSQEKFDVMHTWEPSDADTLSGWVLAMRKYAVYFSEPLDLDMSMLAAFPEAYKQCIPTRGGPRMEIDAAAKVVLGEGGPGIAIYKDKLATYGGLMAEYRYHFLTNSKPATHLEAFTHLDDAALVKGMPETYRALLKHVADNVRLT